MTTNGTMNPAYAAPTGTGRHDWVDYAKGICIVMVVTMHSTLGVESAVGHPGFMHAVVEFAKPFRMPDFFLISGLFLARVIDRDWRTYLDRKVVHFAYFYVLWVSIQFAFKAPGVMAAQGGADVAKMYLLSFIEPFGTLWFIYLLPIFFVVCKLTQRVPPAAIWIVGAALELARIHTGWTVIDEFASRFVYFYSGYLFANFVFRFARDVQAAPAIALAGIAVWALVNAAATSAGVADWRLMSMVLGFAGCGAVIAVAALLARVKWIDALRYCGEHSLVVYLGFFLPMAATRTLLIKTGIIQDAGIVALVVTIGGVVGALAMWWGVRNSPLRLLYDRPAAFWLTPKPPSKPTSEPRVAIQAAE